MACFYRHEHAREQMNYCSICSWTAAITYIPFESKSQIQSRRAISSTVHNAWYSVRAYLNVVYCTCSVCCAPHSVYCIWLRIWLRSCSSEDCREQAALNSELEAEPSRAEPSTMQWDQIAPIDREIFTVLYITNTVNVNGQPHAQYTKYGAALNWLCSGASTQLAPRRSKKVTISPVDLSQRRWIQTHTVYRHSVV